MQSAMTIGRLALEAGVNVETIRFYQRRGLLETPRKPFRGHRAYSIDAAKRIRFIKRAQSLGFTLDEIGGLLRADVDDRCANAKHLAERKLATIDRNLFDLALTRDALAALVSQCGDEKNDGACPIIRALEQDD